MTYHIKCQEYKCPECSALYIPFKKDFVCPNCGESTDEFYDFVPELIRSIRGNKRKEGSYTPSAWAYLNFTDYVQYPIFNLFDCLEEERPENEIEYINNWFDKIQWEQEYFKNYVREIAFLVYEDYKANRNSYLCIRPIKELKRSLWRKLCRVFMS